MSYYAELDENNIVLRVIVADDPEWIDENLGGTWVRTSDPDDTSSKITYAGVGMGYSDNLPNLFAEVWDEEYASTLDDEGKCPYNGGEVVWHKGKLWTNILEGTTNVNEPGVTGWNDSE